jgi:esterase/lipase
MPSTSPPGARIEGAGSDVIRSHFLNMVIFSWLVAVFFAYLTQSDGKDRIRVILIIGTSMGVISLIVAYVMYPFPLR